MKLNLHWLVVAFAIFFAPLASAQSAQYEEGTHYMRLPTPIKTADANKIEVAEYFSYGCPHCFQFDPMISAWEAGLGEDVKFKRTPAVWNRPYEVYAQTYFTAESMGVLEKVHTPLFIALHQERRRLDDPKDMALFFAEFGVDPIDLAKVFNSFGVNAAVRQAESHGRAYRSRGVPAIIVNGKYRIEASMAGGSNANMLRIADFLIAKERAERGDQTAGASE